MTSSAWARWKRPLHCLVTATSLTSFIASPITFAVAQDQAQATDAAASIRTTTPIKHIVLIIGENRTFDHVFATYQPKSRDTIRNLLSEGIVKADGTPGPNFGAAAPQNADVTGSYQISPQTQRWTGAAPPPGMGGAPSKASDNDPPPFGTLAAATAFETEIGGDGLDSSDIPLLTTGATGLPSSSPDTRIANYANLPVGPFQITGPNLPYDSYTASPVHRFFQMWQQTDCAVAHASADNPSGCRNDLFPFVEIMTGTGGNGKPRAANFNELTTGEGSASMGFYNMTAGDVPYFKSLADQYTISDNFHQSIMGGTGANHIAIGTGLAMYYSDGQGHKATPPSNEIENPNPQPGTNNWYTEDGYSGGSYVACADTSQPGVAPIADYLGKLPGHPARRCEQNAYYLVNNYNPGYLGDGSLNTSTFTIPPSSQPTIADRLDSRNVSWRYYGAGWNNYVKDPTSEVGGIYCNICNPFQYSTRIMTDAAERTQHLKDVTDLDADVAAGTLPAVSIVKPDGLLDGHPASSKLGLFEGFSRHIIQEIQNNKTLWKDTAILVTFDEGGGYWDSGYIQPVDFFGDGTRIPAIMVSRFATGGHVSHDYADQVSFLKFVERNWGLQPVSRQGRDNLPDPVSVSANPYAPVNSPAIGDLMDMFDFRSPQT